MRRSKRDPRKCGRTGGVQRVELAMKHLAPFCRGDARVSDESHAGNVPEKPVDGVSYHNKIIAEYSCTDQGKDAAPRGMRCLPRQTSVFSGTVQSASTRAKRPERANNRSRGNAVRQHLARPTEGSWSISPTISSTDQSGTGASNWMRSSAIWWSAFSQDGTEKGVKTCHRFLAHQRSRNRPDISLYSRVLRYVR